MNQKITKHEDTLYNNIILLARNKIFYTKFGLSDTFANRIHLIFLHISFIFIKIKQEKGIKIYDTFYQKMFDLIFLKIESNMREIGYGDVSVNKNMKILVKNFYNILLDCEKYDRNSLDSKKKFLDNYLKSISGKNPVINADLVNYFDKYHSFCIDLTPDSVLSGELNFNYNK